MGRVRLTRRIDPEGSQRVEMQQDTAVEDLVVPQGATSVPLTVEADLRLSDFVYWGGGTWDRVGYSIGLHCSVTLQVAQTEEGIAQGKHVAVRRAMDCISQNMPAANLAAVAVTKQAFPNHFKE